MVLALRGLRARFTELLRRVRTPSLRTAKATIAAMASYVVADTIGTSQGPVLAPLTALLVVQVTMYRTVNQSVQRIASVLSGVLIAVGVATVVGLTWWSLGAIVAAALVVGRLLRLGDQVNEVAISAMLILAVGGASNVASSRVYETLIGAGVGVLVSIVLPPPLYLRPAGEALNELSHQMANFMRSLAGTLRPSWSRSEADRWLNAARELGGEINRADEVLSRVEESARLNPRGRKAWKRQPQLRTALGGLERCYLSLRELCRALLDRTYFVPPEEEVTAYSEDVRSALAEVLDAAADAVAAVPEVALTPAAQQNRSGIDTALTELNRRRNDLSRLLLVDPYADADAWAQHGALLSAVDRLRFDVDAAVRHPEHPWRPPTFTGHARETLRRRREQWQRLRRARQLERQERQESTGDGSGPAAS